MEAGKFLEVLLDLVLVKVLNQGLDLVLERALLGEDGLGLGPSAQAGLAKVLVIGDIEETIAILQSCTSVHKKDGMHAVSSYPAELPLLLLGDPASITLGQLNQVLLRLGAGGIQLDAVDLVLGNKAGDGRVRQDGEKRSFGNLHFGLM